MPFIPVDGICQAELVCSLDTQVIQNVLHFEAAAGLNPTNMGELGAHLVAWWNTNIKPNVPTSQSLTQIKLVDLTTEIAPVVIYATGLPSAGSNASPALPNNCALVITKRTALRGRSYRGRFYFGALNEASVTANTVSVGLSGGLVTALNLLNNFTTATEEWFAVVVSRYTNNLPRPGGIATRITSHDTDSVVDSQRRRLPRRGA